MLEDDNFFDLITRLQGRRMDDQRCEMRPDEDPNELPQFLRLPAGANENRGAVGGREENTDDEAGGDFLNTLVTMVVHFHSLFS